MRKLPLRGVRQLAQDLRAAKWGVGFEARNPDARLLFCTQVRPRLLFSVANRTKSSFVLEQLYF